MFLSMKRTAGRESQRRQRSDYPRCAMQSWPTENSLMWAMTALRMGSLVSFFVIIASQSSSSSIGPTWLHQLRKPHFSFCVSPKGTGFDRCNTPAFGSSSEPGQCQYHIDCLAGETGLLKGNYVLTPQELQNGSEFRGIARPSGSVMSLFVPLASACVTRSSREHVDMHMEPYICSHACLVMHVTML